MERSQYLVFSDPVEGAEAAYHDWYDRHVGDIVKVPGFAAAQRYELDPAESAAVPGARRFVVMYEIEGDVATARAALREAAMAGAVERPDPTCVESTIYSQIYRPIRPRVESAADVTAPESKPLSLEDRFEIHDLMGRYAWAFDARNGDAYAQVFTEDGIMQGPVSKFEGSAALTTFANNHPKDSSQHRFTNLVIEGGGDAATAKSYVLASVVDANGIRQKLMGTYHDTLRRTADGWRIAHRRLVINTPEITVATLPA